MATVAALFDIEESRTLWAVWGTTQLHIGCYRSVRSGEWLVTFRSSSSDNIWTSLVNHPCLCLIAPISQHIMLPQSTVATALIFNWVIVLEKVVFFGNFDFFQYFFRHRCRFCNNIWVLTFDTSNIEHEYCLLDLYHYIRTHIHIFN